MNDTPFFALVVIAKPQPWPYYAEIPYTAWPSSSLDYDSFGNCRPTYSRTWSYLTVVNRATNELLLVLSAERWNTPLPNQDLVWTQRDRLPLASLGAIPLLYAVGGNVVIAAPPDTVRARVARVAALFLERLGADRVFDCSLQREISGEQWIATYAGKEERTRSKRSCDDVHAAFRQGEAWHRAHKSYPVTGFWWKTPADIRAQMEREDGQIGQ